MYLYTVWKLEQTSTCSLVCAIAHFSIIAFTHVVTNMRIPRGGGGNAPQKKPWYMCTHMHKHTHKRRTLTYSLCYLYMYVTYFGGC